MLAQKLNMDDDAAELWIVKLIRTAKLQVKSPGQGREP
jgi:hypothetical protein